MMFNHDDNLNNVLNDHLTLVAELLEIWFESEVVV